MAHAAAALAVSNPPVATTITAKDPRHAPMANAIRALAMDAVQKANSGHPGMPMGMADVATVLWRDFLSFDPANPLWPNRDRFVLSGGHGSMLLYALLYLTGYEKMTIEQIRNFRQLHSLTAGHPEVMQDAGIETTTGPLGQGIATAVGMAMAEQLLSARFGDAISNHYTYVTCGDGDLMEGISHEAASLAGHLGLGKLIVLYDDNDISIDGPTALSFSDDTAKRFEAYGWSVSKVDGHNADEIHAAIAAARKDTAKPSLICCKTTIGFGAPTKAGTAGSHGSPLGPEEIAGARKALGWDHEAFVVPQDILDDWRAVGARGQKAREAWDAQLKAAPAETQKDFAAALNGDINKQTHELIAAFKAKMYEQAPKIATRAASGKVLEDLVPAMPSLIGGSADLTGSNLTLVKSMGGVARGHFGGRYVYYGVREHAMAAAMNGLALHGGIIPYGGTFLSFTDYCRPAIRLSALMKQRVIYVMTHDSIGLGEDGPTHQPVEHLAALRCIPNLYTLRPCDVIETAECWQIALESQTTPSVLVLTRQNLPLLRTADGSDNKCARGAYVLKDSDTAPVVNIWASGSEVEIAVKAQGLLAEKGVTARVISVPSLELFLAQGADYQRTVRGAARINVAVEAAVRQGWDAVIGHDGIFVGMKSFGESAPYEKLYEHFGITAENVVAQVSAALKG